MFGLHLAYLDESATRNRFFLGAVVMDGDCALALGDELDAVMDRAARDFPIVSRDSELHGHSIFHGKDAWAGLPPRARINVYDRALAAIGSHPVQIYLRGIDIDGQKARYRHPDPPHDVVLQHLLERIDENVPHPVLVIADEVHEHDRTRHRANLRSFRTSGTPGYRSSSLPRIVDTLHYADSKHSRLVQAADLVTYLHVRITCHVNTDPRASRANQMLWGRVRDRVRCASVWHPQGVGAPIPDARRPR